MNIRRTSFACYEVRNSITSEPAELTALRDSSFQYFKNAASPNKWKTGYTNLRSLLKRIFCHSYWRRAWKYRNCNPKKSIPHLDAWKIVLYMVIRKIFQMQWITKACCLVPITEPLSRPPRFPKPFGKYPDPSQKSHLLRNTALFQHASSLKWRTCIVEKPIQVFISNTAWWAAVLSSPVTCRW